MNVTEHSTTSGPFQASFQERPRAPISDQAMIYVVTDNPGLALQVDSLAHALGLDCEHFESAEQFRRNYGGGTACVVATFDLPAASGLELQRSFRDDHDPLPFVFVASKPTTRETVRAMKEGAYTVLELPLEGDLVRSTLRAAIADGRSKRRRAAQQRDVRRRISRLTASEYLVLQRMFDGIPNKCIAKDLKLSLRTVESRRRRIFQKMGADSVAKLIRLVLSVAPRQGVDGHTD